MRSKDRLPSILFLAIFCTAWLSSFAIRAQELTTAQQVRALSPDQAEMGRPVHVRGQVLVLSGWKNSFFFSDGTAGISVDRSDLLPALHPGDLVELAGRTAPGAFAPIIISSRIRIVGKKKLPSATLRGYHELAGGSEDSQWVQVRGVVQSAWIEQSWGRRVLFLDLGMGDGHLIARVRDFSVSDPSDLVDAEVRVRGVCGTNFNDRRQFVGLRLFVADMDAVTIVNPPPLDPFQLPLERLENIQRFSPGKLLQHRHRVSGTVTYQGTGEGLYVQDGEAGLYIVTAQPALVSVGDRIEAVGFAGSGGYSPQLHGAIVRVTGAQEPPRPITLRAEQLIGPNADGFLTSRYDGLLVRMPGRLLERISGASQDELVVSSSGQIFRGYLVEHGGGTVSPVLPLGSELELTGVAAITSDEGGEPHSFQLMLRTAQDVVLIRSPSWWGTRQSLYVLILAAGAVLACLLAIAHLRRRIWHQKEVIRELTRVIDARERGPLPIETPLRRWAAVGFGIAILLTSLMAFLSWRGGREAEADDVRVAHTNAVLDAIATASADLVKLETSGRAYSLSGEPDLLVRFERGERNLFPDLEMLRRLVADNLEQQSRLVVLLQRANHAASFAANIVTRRKRGPYPAGADAVDMERTINAVDEQIGAMRTDEKRQLQERTRRSNSRRRSTDAVRGLGMFLGVGLLILAGVAIHREINLTAMARAQTFTLNAELTLRSVALKVEVAERKLAQEALMESDARRTFAMKTAKLGEWSFDMISAKATCSLRHYQIFGYDSPPPEWNMEVFLSHVDPGDHIRVREYVDRSLSEKTRLNFEARILCRNGEARWIWACGDWQQTLSGESLCLGGIIGDITDRKRAERDLADMKFALDEHAIVATADARGRLIYANDRFCAISRFSREELVGQDHRILNSGHHERKFFADMYRSVAMGKVWHGEIQNRAKDGSLYWVDTTVVPFVRAGKPIQYIAMLTDITERKRAELMREHLAAAVVEFSDDAIISKTLASTITTWNSGAEKLFGYTPEEAIGKSMLVLMPPERTGEEAGILERIARGERVDHFETVHLRKDGNKIDVSVTISPIRDISGAIIGASKIARDITQRKAAEREIKELKMIFISATKPWNEAISICSNSPTLPRMICNPRSAASAGLSIC